MYLSPRRQGAKIFIHELLIYLYNRSFRVPMKSGGEILNIKLIKDSSPVGRGLRHAMPLHSSLPGTHISLRESIILYPASRISHPESSIAQSTSGISYPASRIEHRIPIRRPESPVSSRRVSFPYTPHAFLLLPLEKVFYQGR